MSDTKDITVLVLVGSLRAGAINRELAELAIESAPDGVRLELFDQLGELPFYNEDLDNEDVAEPVVALRRAAADADAALGQYGGVWTHDETRKSFGIAGPRVVEDLRLSVQTTMFNGKHPRENAEVAANLRDIVGKLAAEVG